MPLTPPNQPGGYEPDDRRMAIGFWMMVKDAFPLAPIRVFVTYETLAQIEPSQPSDPAAAEEIFGRHRALIEALASDKFDEGGVEDEVYEGMAVVRISSDDLP